MPISLKFSTERTYETEDLLHIAPAADGNGIGRDLLRQYPHLPGAALAGERKP